MLEKGKVTEQNNLKKYNINDVL